MMKKLVKIFCGKYVFLIFALLLALGLRFWKYGNYPISGETKDEYAWTWLGESLLNGQPPTSWSWFGHYKNTYTINIDQNPYRIVSPVFDNPPLFSLIPGLMVTLRHTHGIQIPSITLIRWPMIWIGTLNVGLVWLTARIWRNKKQADISALLMACIPIIVFSSRMVLAENLVVTFMLLALILLGSYLKTGRSYLLYFIGIVCGLSILTKVTGIFVAFAAISLLLSGRKSKPGMIVGIVTLLTASTWLIYAYRFGFDVFMETQLAQSSLPIGWGSIVNLFLRIFTVDSYLLDGWFLLGLIVLFASLFVPNQSTQSKLDPIKLTFICWLVIFVAAVGEQNWHGWYKYPLYPLMVMEIARIWDNKDYLLQSLIPFYIFGFLLPLRFLLIQLEVKPTAIATRIGIVPIIVLYMAQYINRINPTHRKLIYLVMLILCISVSSLVVLKLNSSLLHMDNVNFFPPGAGV